jgi:mannosyltransferase
MKLFTLSRKPQQVQLKGDAPLAPTLFSPESPKTTQRQRILAFVIILSSMLGVVAISKFILLKQSIRLDEAQTLWQTSHSVPGLLKVVAQDVHVPLYHLVVHFWLLYIGTSISSVRLLSLGFFLVTIPFVYLLGRQVMAYKWALVATVIFSFLPFMNWYANEARMYTMLAMMAIINQYFFVRIMRSKSYGWIGFVLSAMVGVYSHYFFVFNLVAEGIYFLANRKYFPAKTLRKLLALAVLLGVLLSPWLYYFVKLGSASATRPMVPKPSTVDFFNAYSQFIFGFQDDRINTILVSCWPLLVVFAFFAVRRSRGLNRSVQFLITIGLLPVLLAYGLSLVIQPFFLSRYLISSIAALVIAMVWFISLYPKRLAMLMTVALVGVLIGTAYAQDYGPNNPERENYQQAVSYIQTHASQRDVIVLSAPFTVYPFEYYYNGPVQIQTIPIWNRAVAGGIPAYQESQLPSYVDQIKKNHQDLYVLLSYNQGYEKQVKLYLDTHLARTASKHFSPDMNLYVYRANFKPIQAL